MSAHVTAMSDQFAVSLSIELYMPNSPEDISALKEMALVIDNENGCEVPEQGYSLAQAMTVVLHHDPQWLFQHLIGWYVDTPWDELADNPALTKSEVAEVTASVLDAYQRGASP